MAEKFKAFMKAEKDKKLAQEAPPARSPKRSMSPFSQKLSLKNPETLLAAPQASTTNSENIAEAEISLPNMSVPPPNFFGSTSAPPPTKTAEEMEYEKKVAAFISRTSEKAQSADNLDKKIEKHLETKSGRKRRTFTDFPVYDDVKPQSSNFLHHFSFRFCPLVS